MEQYLAALVAPKAQRMKKLEEKGVLSFWQDNPGGEWLTNEQSRNGFGAITGGFWDVGLDPKQLVDLPGEMGEHLRISPNDARVKEYAQLMRDGKWDWKYSPAISVDKNGRATIFEGNHRIRAAAEVGIPAIPVEIKYGAGGELAGGPMSPARVAQAALFSGIPMTADAINLQTLKDNDPPLQDTYQPGDMLGALTGGLGAAALDPLIYALMQHKSTTAQPDFADSPPQE